MDNDADIQELREIILTHVASSIRIVLQKFTALEQELGVDLNGESKRFLGHLIAEVIKRRAGFGTGKGADFFFKGEPLEIKHTIHNNWMIAQENVGKKAILIKTNLEEETFSVGYLELVEENLTKGQNRDTKVSVNTKGKERITWWVTNNPF